MSSFAMQRTLRHALQLINVNGKTHPRASENAGADHSAPDCRAGKCETSTYGQPNVILTRRTFKAKSVHLKLFGVLHCEIVQD